MKNLKTSLDRYLTTEPCSAFDDWCEEVIDKQISDMFYLANEEWLMVYDGLCNEWLNKLYKRGYSPNKTALIIERAYNTYIKTNKQNGQV